MSIHRQTDKDDVVYMYIYTMEYYYAIKTKKTQNFAIAATWLVLERIMLSCQTAKNNIASCDLYAKSKKYNKLVNVPKNKQSRGYRE